SVRLITCYVLREARSTQHVAPRTWMDPRRRHLSLSARSATLRPSWAQKGARMNLPRVAIAAVVAWVVYVGVSFVVHTMLLDDLYMQHLSAMRPEADQARILPIGFVFALV